MKNVWLLFLLGIIACSENPNKALVVGKWKTIDWTIESSGKKVNQKMDFTFETDARYEVDYGELKEVGNYRINETTLYTREDERSEKSVKIVEFTQDTFIFQMNRAGRLEQVVLVRE